METMEVCGRNYPVIGYVEDETLGTVPLLDIPMMSDYNWQLRPLQSRLKNPELYREVLGGCLEGYSRPVQVVEGI